MNATPKHEKADVFCESCGQRHIIECDTVPLNDVPKEFRDASEEGTSLVSRIRRGDILCPTCDGRLIRNKTIADLTDEELDDELAGIEEQQFELSHRRSEIRSEQLRREPDNGIAF